MYCYIHTHAEFFRRYCGTVALVYVHVCVLLHVYYDMYILMFL